MSILAGFFLWTLLGIWVVTTSSWWLVIGGYTTSLRKVSNWSNPMRWHKNAQEDLEDRSPFFPTLLFHTTYLLTWIYFILLWLFCSRGKFYHDLESACSPFFSPLAGGGGPAWPGHQHNIPTFLRHSLAGPVIFGRLKLKAKSNCVNGKSTPLHLKHQPLFTWNISQHWKNRSTSAIIIKKSLLSGFLFFSLLVPFKKSWIKVIYYDIWHVFQW